MSDQEPRKLWSDDIGRMLIHMEQAQNRRRDERDRRILVGHERAQRDPAFRYRVTTIAHDLLDSPHLQFPPETEPYHKLRTAIEIAVRVLVIDEWMREAEQR